MTNTATDGVRFFVAGLAKPGGSKKGFYIEKIKRVVITDASGKKGREWRADVKATAYEAMQGRSPFARDVPLFLGILFVMPRPGSQLRANGEVKDWALLWPVTKPDATKLIRSAEDAMTGIVWVDDAQVVLQLVGKRYGSRIGAEVSIRPMTMEEWYRLAGTLLETSP